MKQTSSSSSSSVVGEVVWLENGKGLKACILGVGATIARLVVPNKGGEGEEVVLGYDDLEQYGNNDFYFGCVVGRVCNRIEEGKVIFFIFYFLFF